MKKDFVVLGIYEGHVASSALSINGKIVAAAHEERFSGLKCDVGFPYLSAKFCIKKAGIDSKEIDCVAISNLDFNKNGIANIMFKRPATYSIQDWIKENELYWKKTLIENQKIDTYYDLMGGDDKVKDHYYDFSSINFKQGPDEISKKFNKIRMETVENILGIDKNKVKFLPHYILHHYHAYYSGNNRDINNTFIMHQEGDGGEFNAGVSIPTNKGIKWISGTNLSDIGRLYQWITLILGMKPYHHEYKIMGLAPYSTNTEVEKSYHVLKNIFKIDKDSLSIIYDIKPKDLFFHFKENFLGHRFDGIAGALQLLIENLLSELTLTIIKKLQRNKICYGGGVAMNVKANGILAQQENVSDIFVPVSPSDESNAIGACYFATEKYYLSNNVDPNIIPPLNNVYLGPDYNNFNINGLDRNYKFKFDQYEIKENISPNELAKKISEGNVFGRFYGSSEFGQRSLGNRSIIASISDPNIVEKINQKIKYRDFWMPFCPTILEKYQDKYLTNPKLIDSEYMTMSFPINAIYKDKLIGGIHLGDNTARPQILKHNKNPEFYNLIEELEKITGVGAIINTSFNLHGRPVVGTPEDCLYTLENSNLDGVVINNILITKKK